jgi:hypothetical protein
MYSQKIKQTLCHLANERALAVDGNSLRYPLDEYPAVVEPLTDGLGLPRVQGLAGDPARRTVDGLSDDALTRGSFHRHDDDVDVHPLADCD